MLNFDKQYSDTFLRLAAGSKVRLMKRYTEAASAKAAIRGLKENVQELQAIFSRIPQCVINHRAALWEEMEEFNALMNEVESEVRRMKDEV